MEIPATRNRRNFGQIALFLQFGRVGRRVLMEGARLAARLDPSIFPVVEDWDRMKPPLQNAVDLDALCEAHRVDAAHFISVVAEAEMRFCNDPSVILAGMSFPKVVMQSVKTALKSDGLKDRMMLMKHADFLPVSKGQQLGMVNHAAIRAEANTNIGKPLPIFERTITTLDNPRQDEE